MIQEHIIAFRKLQLVKEMITQGYYKIIATNVNKRQALDADPKAMQQNNFTGNLNQAGNTTVVFIIEEVK